MRVDYLVIGAGATAMAFVDTLITETHASVVMVDRNHSPGGHWVSSYPFVRLHQPSAYYGVNSRPLGGDTIDSSGANKGYYELAGGAEVCAYYDAVMREQLLPTGRVSYLPDSEYLSDGRIRAPGGDEVEVEAHRVVDSTFVGVTVPSMRPPPYEVASGVECIPPNELPRRDAYDRYMIVGAGKTAMDTCLWLIGQGIDPERLTWIKPRDSWLLDRANIQPGPQFTKSVLADVAAQLKSVEKAQSVDDLFARLAEAGSLLRIDESIEPRMYRCAIVSRAELEQLRLISDVVRLGHVRAIERDRLVLDDGAVPVSGRALFIDCTAVGLGRRDVRAVFGDDRITLQTVRTCQPVFSAALIAHVEAAYADNHTKNALCRPIPNPEVPLDWLRMMMIYNENQIRWFDEPDIMAWLDSARLNVLSHSTAVVSPRAREKIIGVMRSQLHNTNAKLESLLA